MSLLQSLKDWPRQLKLSAVSASLAQTLYYARCEVNGGTLHWYALSSELKQQYRDLALSILQAPRVTALASAPVSAESSNRDRPAGSRGDFPHSSLFDRPNVIELQQRLQQFHERIDQPEPLPLCIWCLQRVEDEAELPYCSTECAAHAMNDDETEARS